MMVGNQIFLDTAYAIALSASNDRYHELAVSLAKQMEEESTRLVKTRAVILELGNALAKQPYRQAAVKLLDSLEQDSNVEIIPLTEQLYSTALDLYRKRQDKEWGMTDCISFVVMQERSLQVALTTDEHFQQAGFHAMLRET